MNLRHVEYVVAVADHGGFRRAAAALHVSQSALSHAIAAIEFRLGAELFHRRGRGVTLTALGRTYVSAGREVLAAHQALEVAVGSATDLRQTTLPVAVQSTSVTATATRLVAGMRRRHPGVLLDIRSQPSPAAVDEELLQGTCEVGISDWVAHRSLATHPLFEDPFFLACPPGTPLPGRTVDLSKRFKLPMILPHGWRQMRAAQEQESYSLDNEVAVETDARDLMLALVLAGTGAAMVPEPIARTLAAAGAVVAGLDPPITREVLLVRRPGRLSPAAAAFVAVARALADPVAGRRAGTRRAAPIEDLDHCDDETASDTDTGGGGLNQSDGLAGRP